MLSAFSWLCVQTPGTTQDAGNSTQVYHMQSKCPPCSPITPSLNKVKLFFKCTLPITMTLAKGIVPTSERISGLNTISTTVKVPVSLMVDSVIQPCCLSPKLRTDHFCLCYCHSLLSSPEEWLS